MTDEKKTAAGLSEAPTKFEHESDAALSALWQDWQCRGYESDQADAAEDAAADALPEWVKEVRRKIAEPELTLLGKDLPAEAKQAAQRAIAGLDTAEYRAARAGLDAAKQRVKDRDDALNAVEESIITTPSQTFAGLFVKLKIGVREIFLNHGDADDRLPEESELGIYTRMTLSALADLERLAGADAGPYETALRQGQVPTGRSGM